MTYVTISEGGQFVCRIRFDENFISFVKYEIVVYITDVVGISKLTVRNMNTYRCVFNGVPLKPMIKVFSEHHITEASTFRTRSNITTEGFAKIFKGLAKCSILQCSTGFNGSA